MDTRFDAVHLRPPSARSPAPVRPSEASWAQAWALESGPAQPPQIDSVRVAWRDASAASTWLAPVREREALPAEQTASVAPAEPQHRGSPWPAPAQVTPPPALAPPASVPPTLLRLPTLQVAQTPTVAWSSTVPAVSTDAAAESPPVAGQGVVAPQRDTLEGPALAARPSPARHAGEARSFAPTHLHVTQSDDGLSVWLRDARLGADAPAALRVLNALATLGGPPTQRPGAVFVNSQPVRLARSDRGPAHPSHIQPPKEDSHGH